jgi:hypothetical protein
MIRRLTLLFLVISQSFFAQSNFYKNNAFDWNQFPQIKNLAKSSFEQTTQIDDHTDIICQFAKSEVRRLLTFYVPDEQAATELSVYTLPDDFDPAYSKFMQVQGRKDLNKGADLEDYILKQFGARMMVKGVWTELKLDYKFKKRRWLQPGGEIFYDDVPVISLQGLKAGSVLQIFYTAVFSGAYGENIFYLTGKYPKVNADYYFEYNVERSLNGFNYARVFNLNDSLVQHTQEPGKDRSIHKLKVHATNLKPNFYPKNTRQSETLPHVVLDFALYTMITERFHDNGVERNNYTSSRPRDFEWMMFLDTNYTYEKIYVKHFSDLRKFMKTLPPLKKDSGALDFLKVYRDTIAQFRYISQNQIYFNESNLKDVGLLDHIARRRVPEYSRTLLEEMLWESNRFFYVANVMDKRLGLHSALIRAHRPYEHMFTVIPEKGRYYYLLSRPNGLNYYPNELPFYFEGGIAAVFSRNFEDSDSNRLGKSFKFIRLQEGTANENTRTENASLSINLEKKEMSYTGKVNLSGQFSTILRHLYLKQAIDSTIEPYYFKRATDKPGAKNQQMKLSAKTSDYPFRHSFNCSETLPISTSSVISVKDWFSFTLNKKVFPVMPQLDYYFDFTYTDIYNFVLIFDKPAEITNADAFTKNMTNEYFDLQSAIQKQENGNYLLSVRFQVKQPCLKVKDVNIFEQQLAALEELNNFSCQIKALD